MIPSCPVCHSTDTQWVGLNLHCLSCDAHTPVHDDPADSPWPSTDVPALDTAATAEENTAALQAAIQEVPQ